MVARRLTLGHVFALTMAGLALLLGALFALLLEGSRRSIIQSADTLRISAGRRTEDRVFNHAPLSRQLDYVRAHAVRVPPVYHLDGTS